MTMSSGNVFADIGFPKAEELLFKDLAIAISDVSDYVASTRAKRMP